MIYCCCQPNSHVHCSFYRTTVNSFFTKLVTFKFILFALTSDSNISFAFVITLLLCRVIGTWILNLKCRFSFVITACIYSNSYLIIQYNLVSKIAINHKKNIARTFWNTRLENQVQTEQKTKLIIAIMVFSQSQSNNEIKADAINLKF